VLQTTGRPDSIGCQLRKAVKHKCSQPMFRRSHSVSGIGIVFEEDSLYLIFPRREKKLIIKSVRGNHWHPYITFYDFELNILKIYKEEKRKFKFNIPIPKGTFYCRITDIYRLNNIHNGLEIKVTH
jgi:hypothetical protein